jgi:hypothetical protein
LPLKNKTNQFFLSFICCRLGRSRIEKERKKRRERERKVRGKHKKNQRKKNKKSERITL